MTAPPTQTAQAQADQTPAVPDHPGLADPVMDAQSAFRALLEAMSHPGRIRRLTLSRPLAPPTPLGPAAGALLLALADRDTPLWLDPTTRRPEVLSWLRFFTAAPITADPAAATFALATAPQALPPLAAFDTGTPEDPAGSTTVIVEATAIAEAPAGAAGPTPPWTLTGPGIRDRQSLVVQGLPPGLPEQWRDNGLLFPQGLDLVITCGDRLAALPRTTRLEPGIPAI